MNRRGFLLAAGAGLGAATISLPPPLLVRMNGSVLPAAHTPDPAAWSDNRITLAWLGPWLFVSRPQWRGYAKSSTASVPLRESAL